MRGRKILEKMAIETVEKLETYQFLIKKIETYLCRVEQTNFQIF